VIWARIDAKPVPPAMARRCRLSSYEVFFMGLPMNNFEKD